jgi:hypothetical protein
MFHPVMRMGLIGFKDDHHLCNLLAQRHALCHWERGPFVEADALWVNGEHAQLVRGRFVRVPSYDPTRPATLLNLKEVDRPTAFTLPLPSPEVQPPELFDVTSPPSVEGVFRKFEAWLQPLAVELMVARGIAERRFSLTSAVYHLVLRGQLLGVVDLEGDVGLLPGVAPLQIASAEWCGRPAAAHEIPPHFTRTPISQVMWQYVSRSTEDLLPERYRRSVVYFRGPPRVAQRLMRDTHMLLLGQLNASPLTLAQMQEQTGLSEREIAQALAALYFAGSITTHPGKTAWVPRSKTLRDANDAVARAGLASSVLETDSVSFAPPRSTDLTVPAALEMRPPRH